MENDWYIKDAGNEEKYGYRWKSFFVTLTGLSHENFEKNIDKLEAKTFKWDDKEVKFKIKMNKSNKPYHEVYINNEVMTKKQLMKISFQSQYFFRHLSPKWIWIFLAVFISAITLLMIGLYVL